MKCVLPKRQTLAFSLIELMTTLVIVGIISAVALPTYRSYVTKVSLAEAVTVIGTVEKNQRKYFAENGTFISAEPNPSAAPGINGVGERGSFGSSDHWRTLGFPVSPGSAVIFSYQAFAGQTPPGSTTPIENDTLYSPNDEMDLVRTGLYNSSLEIVPMKYYVLHANDFQFEFGHWNACAASQVENCVSDCADDTACQATCVGTCVESCRGDRECLSSCEGSGSGWGQTEQGIETINCMQQCYNNGPSMGACVDECSNGQDGICTGMLDSDCGERDNDQIGVCNHACGSVVGSPGVIPNGACASECSDPSSNDGICSGSKFEADCYTGGGDHNTDGGGENGGGDGKDEDPDGGDSLPENTCASFGVSRPVHFGIQEGLEGYSWVVNTAVTNQREGADCWLVVAMTQVINGDTSSTALIQINPGE